MAKKIINIPIVIACLLCFTYTACSDYAIAQDVSKRIDSLFNAVAQKTHFNGSVVVAENGKIIYENPGGYANIDKKVPNSSATNFSLASLSKVFTAIAVMQLKEKGKLNLDDPLIKYLPDFPFANITIKQLLSHTSGLPDFEIFQSYTRASHDKPLCEKDIIPALKKGAELIAAPGTKWRYSNVGFGLLALLVENVSHQSFRQYIQENICKPAGLKNTYVDVPGTNFHDEARATPYVSSFSSDITSGDTLKTDLSDPIQTIAGPGLIVSSVDDLLKFAEALFDDRLLNAVTREEMFTPVRLKNGEFAELEHAPLYNALGWGIDIDTSAGRIASHTGGSPGISTIMLINLTKKQTVIALENTNNRAPLFFGVNAMNILNNKPFGHLRMD